MILHAVVKMIERCSGVLDVVIWPVFMLVVDGV
jgi:hypothetical protein